jgi:hypothetical protein
VASANVMDCDFLPPPINRLEIRDSALCAICYDVGRCVCLPWLPPWCLDCIGYHPWMLDEIVRRAAPNLAAVNQIAH